MFTHSYIKVFHKFTIIRLTAESKLKLVNDTGIKIFVNPIFEMKVVT